MSLADNAPPLFIVFSYWLTLDDVEYSCKWIYEYALECGFNTDSEENKLLVLLFKILLYTLVEWSLFVFLKFFVKIKDN